MTIFTTRQKQMNDPSRSGRSLRRRARALASIGSRCALTCGVAAIGAFGGCEWDSYMDPSVLGRWEHTPTSVPILDRIATIEEQTGDLVDYAAPTDADLLSVAKTYRLGPGDRVVVQIYDIIQVGRMEEYDRPIDMRGNIDIPQLGQITIAAMTVDEARAVIEAKVAPLVPDPLVSIVPVQQRQQTFTILGSVSSPGPYFIPNAEYRLLEAITAGGNFNNSAEYVYVIRQIPLTSEDATPGTSTPGTTPGTTEKPTTPVPPNGVNPTTPTPTGKQLIDIIDSLGKPEPKKPADAPKPGVLTPRHGSAPGAMQPVGDVPSQADRRATAAAKPAGNEAPRSGPAVDLVDGAGAKGTSRPGPNANSSWVFLNGRWQQQASRPATAAPSKPGDPKGTTDASTQRVIRVPLDQLLAGRREMNIVIRPGDILRVPPPAEGIVYMAGQVNRPGIYNLPASGGRLTLERAIIAAGGLANLAIPSRADLTRMTGPDREATIRLDLGAIAERTQPDVYLKANDIVNIGTNFWAMPLAVTRNGFRGSYGYGFILDRNFGTDVFGAPPGSIGNQN